MRLFLITLAFLALFLLALADGVFHFLHLNAIVGTVLFIGGAIVCILAKIFG